MGMTIDDIEALIAADESRTLELKKTTGELKDRMHSTCVLLNTNGGWLIFSVVPAELKILECWWKHIKTRSCIRNLEL